MSKKIKAMSTRTADRKTDSFSFLPMDLSGKLIIKARLGDDIRRVPIHNEDITYDELLLMLQRVYRGKLNNTDDVTLKYQDEDGDMVTVMDSSDLNVAKQISRLLKITIFIHGKEPLPILDANEVQEVRNELIAIRDKVNTLLDAIDGHPKGKATVEPPQSTVQTSQAAVESTSKPTVEAPNKPLASITMFDPLKSSSPSQVSSTDNVSTAHLFSKNGQPSGAPPTNTDFLPNSAGGSKPPPPTGYSSQPAYSASPSPSAPQVQPPPPESSYYLQQQQQQQQKAGFPPPQTHYRPNAASPGPSAPPTSSQGTYLQQPTAYSQPTGYAAGAPQQQQQQQQQQHVQPPPAPQQQPGGYSYGFNQGTVQSSGYPAGKPATAYAQPVYGAPTGQYNNNY